MYKYILTTTLSWGMPLESARIEVNTIEGKEFKSNYNFEEISENVYVLQEEEFLPNEDLVIYLK